MNRQIPKPYDRYKNAKGNEYQVICMAKDSKSGEDVVVYQELYGDFSCYTKPLPMFIRETQPVQLSDEKIQPRQAASENHRPMEISEPKPGEADPALLAFLDADTMEEKSNVLVSIRHRITDRLIDDIAVTLDVVIPEGNVDMRYQQLLSSIKTMQRYESERLR